jgi:hypothetical protein
MAQIGTLVTGAGVTTIIAGQSQCEAMIVIGSVATAMPLQGLQVEIDGVPFININNQPALLAAFSKWCSQFVSTLVGVLLKVATGRIPRNTTYRFTNNGATVPNIFAFSDQENGVPILVGTKQINASSYEDFSKFSALFIGTPANLASAEIVFSNGCKSTMTFAELDALFTMKNQSEANGELLAVTVIDNRDQSIQSVRLNCSAANTILVAKLPDASFAVLNK